MSGTSTPTKRSRCVPLLLTLMATTALGDVGGVPEASVAEVRSDDGPINDVAPAAEAVEAVGGADAAPLAEAAPMPAADETPTIAPADEALAAAPIVEEAPPVHNAAENYERVAKTANSRRSFQRAHPQADTDVHSQFLGVVDVEKFISAYGSEASLVSHIAASARPHTNHSGYQLTPIVEPGPQITNRSATGDCFIRAYTAHSAILDAAARSEDGVTVPVAVDLKADALIPCLTVTGDTDADSAYQVRDALIQRWPAVRAEDFDNDDELQEARYIAYCKSAVQELADDGIKYSEQSLSAQTLQQRIKRNVFSPSKCGSDAAPGGSEPLVRWLASVPSSHLGNYDANVEANPPTRPAEQEWESTLTTMRTLLARADVIGIDVSGPEKYRFDADGKERFKELYNTMSETALVKGTPLVLRAAVGQGSVDPNPGRPYSRDTDYQLSKSGEPLHRNRARHNLDTILAALQELKTDGRLRKRHVILRFGHATHATPDHVMQMKELGVIAEVSLGADVSNDASADRLTDHSFLTMVYYQDPIILSTGGTSMVGTTLKDEYKQAYSLVEDFLAGTRKVRVKYDSQLENHNKSAVDADGWLWLSVGDLQADELDRYLYAYNCLLDSAAQYKAWMTAPAGMALPAIAGARIRAECPRMRL